MLARFHHADKKPIENQGMFGERFMKRFATLYSRGDIADDGSQPSLSFRIRLLVQSGQGLNKRNTRLDHRRKLAGEENEVGFFYFGRSFARLAGRFSLQRKHHKAATHQAGHGVVLVEGFLNSGHDASGSVTRLIGECDHKKVIMKIVANTVPMASQIPQFLPQRQS